MHNHHPLVALAALCLAPTLAACAASPGAQVLSSHAYGSEVHAADGAARDDVATAANEVGAAAPSSPSMAQKPPRPAPLAPPTQAIAPLHQNGSARAATIKMVQPDTIRERPGSEQYTDYGINPFVSPAKDPLSTFAIDVDTASYAIARSKLQHGTLPPFSAVRAEEFLNYFDYDYPNPQSGPFAVHLHAAPSPFDKGHHILRVGIQAKRIAASQRKPVHLVYLVDTSGSMRNVNKLGLVKKSLQLLTNQLKVGDTVALCTYAGSTRLLLPPTGASDKPAILHAIRQLSAGGGTAMSSGIQMAYAQAERTLVKGHVNRVIVLSDGDANIGPASHEQILDSIAHYKDMGITLSTVGFGRGNYKDTMMEQLANKGDGNYQYIDSPQEARRAFGEQLGGMLEVVARDVKIQVEFDPRVVERYRLIGYENRKVADRDFRNDAVDAGEIGAGHDVTAVYDLVLQPGASARRTSPLLVRLRHKRPEGSNNAIESTFSLRPDHISRTFDAAPNNFRFAAAVAGFAEILRQSPHARGWKLATIHNIAERAMWGKKSQQELLTLVAAAERQLPGS